MLYVSRYSIGHHLHNNLTRPRDSSPNRLNESLGRDFNFVDTAVLVGPEEIVFFFDAGNHTGPQSKVCHRVRIVVSPPAASQLEAIIPAYICDRSVTSPEAVCSEFGLAFSLLVQGTFSLTICFFRTAHVVGRILLHCMRQFMEQCMV